MKKIWGKDTYSSLAEIADPSHTALLMIDMQNDFCDPAGYYASLGWDLSSLSGAIANSARLAAAARTAGVLVIWVKQTLLDDARADSPAWLRRRTRGDAGLAPEWTLEGTWGAELVTSLEVGPQDLVVSKHRSSAFVGTPLNLLLRANRIESLIIAGVLTQGCVESTARDATFYDHYVVLAEDCVATTDPDLHRASLLCQSTRYDFASSSQLLSAWQTPVR